MSNDNQPDEQAFWELTATAETAMDEVALNDRVYKAIEEALGRIARDFYPGLPNWHAEQLRELANRISIHASQFAVQLSNLDATGHRPQ